MTDEIKSKIFNRGHEMESDWPPLHGTGGSGRMKWCKVQQKMVKAGDELVEVLASVAHGFIQDEMKATLHPVDGKYYTSQSKFRAVTKAHGYEEVGTAYENGYEPEKEADEAIRQHSKNVFNEVIERMQHGRITNRR